MPNEKDRFRVFISAAEPSGDAHCAGLMTALQSSGYDIDFVGVGGPKMAEAGCELLENTAGKAAMIYKAFSHVARFYKLIKRIRRYLTDNKVDLVIVCDSPAFNFHVAKAAKKMGIKTLFYVAPQLWAWGGWRIGKLRERCDKLCCILPFEQDWFSRRGMDVAFVGNPLLDKLQIDPTCHEKYRDFEPEKARFALMPGSRNAEIDSLWRPMQQIALRLKQKYSAATFVTVAVDTKRQQILKEAQIPGFECQYSVDSVNSTAGAVDFSIVASGSATLEIAAAGCPMVIMYQSSRVLWYLLGWMMKTKYLSLVNILADRELVPEFMPNFSSIEPIVASIEKLLQDKERLGRISSELTALTEPLAKKKACEEVAKIAVSELRMVRQAHHPERSRRIENEE
ncbi:MAG: lipid-A-disaccharide synthase [Planctomycetes bacterium B3_Pla]|nr:MAG: lipid-A-disaccharide synthase [Planctomycetes bacterium B3_Pla]